jgi:filamentous hemagglutinin family protein
MTVDLFYNFRRWLPGFVLMAWLMCLIQAHALPTGGTVSQGQATIGPGSSSSILNINQTSANALINWSSFDIANGETVNFNQPSATSLTFNFINEASASSINGTLNANGIVILQNPNGFSVGGTASINAHGLVMTTASIPSLNLSGGGPWSFNTPPPTAKIVNYGQINISGGGSAFLIADDIENDGTISAPQGNIGLYAGEKVLVSTSPDGRGLSARVTMPEGSVDNTGKLIADAGSIVAQAQVINQNGLVEANTIQNDNGTIELVASDTLNIGASSQITANDDSTYSGSSPGGFVILSSGNSYNDTSTSTISVSGSNPGQNDGIIEIFDPSNPINTKILSNYYAYLVNPYDMTLSGNPTDTSSSDPNINVNDLGMYSKIDLWALDNIEVSTYWYLPNPSVPATLNLNAGNNLIVDDGCGIGTSFGNSGYDWDLNLTAGSQLPYGTMPASGSDGIYLNGNAEIYTLSGDINLWAAGDVIVAGGDSLANGTANIGYIETDAGGSINVTAEYGNVFTGINPNGYDFGVGGAPYYIVDQYLGGISTYAGGNVTITAGGNVTSYLPYELIPGPGQLLNWLTAQGDAGTGAFGPEPGNVTITAGGNIYGNYVVANGVGTITAGGNIGVPVGFQDPTTGVYLGFALSLVSGSWNVFAPHGSIYVTDITNPNGIFNDTTGSGYHAFDYSPTASVLLDAGDDVEITGSDAPQAPPTAFYSGTTIPMLFPPSLTVDAGGDFTLDTSVVLFPSPDQNLNVNVGGDFNGNNYNLEMSDSAATSWNPGTTAAGNSFFGPADRGPTPLELDNPATADIFVGGDMDDVNLYTDMRTILTVAGNLQDSSLVAENMHPGDVTSVLVGGSMDYSPLYSFVALPSAISSAESSLPTEWDSVFDYAINPADVAAVESINVDDPATIVAIKADGGLPGYLEAKHYLLFPSASELDFEGNPGLVYDPSSLQLGVLGNMSTTLEAQLENGSFDVLEVDSKQDPLTTSKGYLQVSTYNLNKNSGTSAGVAAWDTAIAQLYTESQNDYNPASPELGIQIGGPGKLTVTANSMNLGNSDGIISAGFGSYGPGSPNYIALEGICGTLDSGGAEVDVNVAGDLDMINSCICSIDGGNVNVNAGGDVNLSQGAFIFQTPTCFGIWTSGHSDVSVTADGNINIGSSRIATFNGGNVFIESYFGDVNCGNGANIALDVPGIYLNSEVPFAGEFGELDNLVALAEDPAPYGSGILAEYPTKKYQTPGATGPGNITVETPKGNITSALGGISQFALDANIGGGPTINLDAGTPGVTATADQGNVLLGGGGVIGGTINIDASGNVQGLIVSQQNADINAGQSFNGTVLAGGSANFTGAGSISGTVVGIGGISTGSGSLGNVTLLSQNVSVGGGADQSTLGSSANATAASQAASSQASQSTAQMATTVNNSQEDDKKKKKPKVKVSRVTVILSSVTPRKREATFAGLTRAIPALREKNSDLIASIP